MKRLIPYVAVIALAAAAAGCNKGTGTAYNNSGASATPGSTTVATPSTDTSAPGTSSTTTTTTSTDTSSSANLVADTVTSGKVMAALVADPALKDSDIAVKTEGGIVVLTGTAKSQDQVATATQLAQQQEGVSRVETQIAVR